MKTPNRIFLLVTMIMSMIFCTLYLSLHDSRIPVTPIPPTAVEKTPDHKDNFFFFELGNNNEIRETVSEEKEDDRARKMSQYPRIILLWTIWRSGSNYLGELLSKAVPETFYSVEPLHWWGAKIINGSETVSEAMDYLQDILHCRMSTKYKEQIEYLSGQYFYNLWNTYLSKQCQPKKTCGNLTLISEVCKEAKIHLGKIIRLPLSQAKFLLEDPSLNLKIVYLVRDPRAVLASRQHTGFCSHSTCKDPNVVCSLLEDDLKEVKYLEEAFPRRFQLIQYEKVNKDPRAGLKDLMSFVGLPVSQEQLKFLKPAKTEPDAPFSTHKNASLMVDRWRTKSSFRNIKVFQKSCERPLSMLGLRFFESNNDFRNLSLSLVLPDPQ